MRALLKLCCMCAVFGACRSGSSSHSNDGGELASGFQPVRVRNATGYIINAAQAEGAFPGREAFFTPTIGMLESLEDALVEQGSPKEGAGRQYAGFLMAGHKVLYVKFLCESVTRTHPWHREVPVISEGPCVSHVLFDVESRSLQW